MPGRAIHVVLVTCDALRADHVGPGSDGRGGTLTPRLDALAADGITFTHAVAQGFRTPIAMPSLFTGRYPSRLEWFSMASPFAMREGVRGVLIGPATTVTQILRAHGFTTAGIHSNPLLTRLFGFDKGFDVFDDDLFLAGAPLPAAVKRWAYRLPQLFRVASHLSAARINDKARRWLRRVRGPAFLWLHYMDTHGPYCSQAGFRYWARVRAQLLYQKAVAHPRAVTPAERDTLHTRYRAQVRYVDGAVGRLVDELQRRGTFEDTLIMVSADHGEEFGDHGRFGHHSTLYEELLRVPLIVKLPGARHRGRVVSTPVAALQIVPTILEAAGIDHDGAFDGPSLLPLVEGRPDGALEAIISEAKGPPAYKACIRSGQWKFITDTGKRTRELYDLAADPGERANVVDTAREVAGGLEARLDAALVALRAGDEPERSWTDAVDAATTERLRDLGYL